MRHPESQLQQAIITWWSCAHRGLGISDVRMLFAIPNGGARSKITGAILKAEGVRAGVPDLFVCVPRGGFHGLYLELKSPIGRLRPDQVTFMASATSQGYLCEVSRDFSHATKFIENYLRLT